MEPVSTCHGLVRVILKLLHSLQVSLAPLSIQLTSQHIRSRMIISSSERSRSSQRKQHKQIIHIKECILHRVAKHIIVGQQKKCTQNDRKRKIVKEARGARDRLIIS